MATPITDTALSKDDKELEKQQQQGLPGSSQTSSTSPTSRVASFSSGQQTPGSGRFTNIQNYLNANKQASANFGAKATDKINTGFNQQQSQVDDQNKNLATQFGQGRNQLKAGGAFQQELTGINENLNTGFKNMEDRDLFDTTGQRVSSFTPSGLQQTPETQGLDTSFQNYQSLASGQGIDEQMLRDKQLQAFSGAQGLQSQTQSNLSGLETEGGRDKLFAQTIQPKQGYGATQRSFDKLFLGNSLAGIKSNLQDKTNVANELLNTTGVQQKSVDEIIAGEQNLLNEKTGLLGLAKQGQDSFTNVLGRKENIDFIQKLRDERYNQALGEIKSGNIGSTLAETLGLNDVATYGGGASANKPVSQKITPSGGRQLTAYNADLANAGGSFINQGKLAKSIQDIASEKDYDAYQALQKLALGRDTGVLGGASNLGSAISKNTEGKTLADLISEQDAAYRQNYAGKNIQTLASASEGGSGGFFDNGRGGYGHGASTTVGADRNYENFRNSQSGYGSLASGISTANIDDYLKNGKVNSSSAKVFDRGGTTKSNQAAERRALALADSGTRSKLEEIINQTGVKNKLNIKDDSNTETSKRRDKFKRFV